jgi:hypothetical protein
LGKILDSFWQSAENQKENYGVVLLHTAELRQIGTAREGSAETGNPE